jgi:pimeloyl-ACP methyl ester carboxylesterase
MVVMKKNFAWLGSSIIAAAFAVGVVDVEAAIAVQFPADRVLIAIHRFGDGQTIRRSYPCKIPVLIPDNVPKKYNNNESLSVSVENAGNRYSFKISQGVEFYGQSGSQFKSTTDGDKVKTVNLAGGIQARYLYGGRYVYGRSVLEWKYGNAVYGVWLSEGKLEDAISIANSAIRGGIRNPKLGQNPSIIADAPSTSPTQANTDEIPDASQPEVVAQGTTEEFVGTSQPDATSDEIPDASQPDAVAQGTTEEFVGTSQPDSVAQIPDASQPEVVAQGTTEEFVGTSQPDATLAEIPDASQTEVVAQATVEDGTIAAQTDSVAQIPDASQPDVVEDTTIISTAPSVCPKGMFPATVPPDLKYNHQSPSYAFVETAGIFKNGTTKDGRKIIAETRCNFFRELTRPSGKPKRTWLIIHGLNNDTYSETSATPALADAIAAKYPNDRVIALDWSEASNNQGKSGFGGGIRGVYYAATWIRPVAEATVTALKEQYGLSDAEAASSLNIIGHSLGSLMSAEIGGIYSEGVNSIIALDPPTDWTSQLDPFSILGGYDVDGRTPAYEITKQLGFIPGRKPNLDNIQAPKCFDGVKRPPDAKYPDCDQSSNNAKRPAKFTRAFVGEKSIFGNQGFAISADESFQMHFGTIGIGPGGIDLSIDLSKGLEGIEFGKEHGRVVKAFINLISNSNFRGFAGLEDLNAHRNIKRGGDGHTGIITIDSSDKPLGIFLEHKPEGDLVINPNGKVYYRPLADKVPQLGKAFSATPSVEADDINLLFPIK